MIAASALFVQTSADLMAMPTSGLGGMIEKPMKYDLVPCDVTSGSRAARAHEARKTARAATEKRADFTRYQYVFPLPGETAEGGWIAGVRVTYPLRKSVFRRCAGATRASTPASRPSTMSASAAAGSAPDKIMRVSASASPAT